MDIKRVTPVFIFMVVIFILASDTPGYGRDSADDYYLRALELNRAGDLKGALEELEEAYRRDDDNPKIQKALSVVANNLAVALSGRGESEDALKYYKRALEIFPDDVVRQSYARCLFSAKRPYDAIRVLDDLVASDNPDTEQAARWILAQIHFSLRDFEQAVVELEEIIYQNDKNAEVHFLLARSYEQTGEKQKAAEHLKWVQELTGDSNVQSYAEDLQGRLERENTIEEEFEQDSSHHFKLVFESGRRDDLMDEIIEYLEEAYDDVGRELQFYPTRETKVIIYTPKQFVTVTQLPSWVAGVYQEWIIRIPIPTGGTRGDSLKDVVFHEYTHLLVQALAGGNCPVWLNEGLAVTMQPNRTGFEKIHILQQELNKKSLPAIDKLDSNFIKADSHKQAMIAYISARFLIKFIDEEWGLYRVSRMLEMFKGNIDTSTVLQDVLGFDLERFETRWHEFLEDQ